MILGLVTQKPSPQTARQLEGWFTLKSTPIHLDQHQLAPIISLSGNSLLALVLTVQQIKTILELPIMIYQIRLIYFKQIHIGRLILWGLHLFIQE